MNLFRDPTDLKAYGEHLTQSLITGAVQIEKLAQPGQKVSFKAWSDAVRQSATEREPSLKDGQLEWLWKALTTDPRILRELGAKILSRDEERKTREPVLVLKKGEVLGVFLKSFTAYGAPVFSVPPKVQPEGKITLLGALTMGPGKAGRFECRDVKVTVEIPVEKAGSLDQ
jgi:hypothetical protein